MIDEVENCEQCQYYRFMVDRYGDRIEVATLQAMVERHEEHMRDVHGKGR